jgi:diamine N-acetyltransferase
VQPTVFKRDLAPVEDDLIRLRLLAEGDLPTTLMWRNQDHIRCWFIHSAMVTIEQHQVWFEGYRVRDDDYVFIIEERERSYQPVGQISLYQIDWQARRAEFGRLMIGDPAARGRGLAKAATTLLLGVAFDQFGLDEVRLEVFGHNSAAISVYLSCGFQPCGQRDNLVLMSLPKSPAR